MERFDPGSEIDETAIEAKGHKWQVCWYSVRTMRSAP